MIPHTIPALNMPSTTSHPDKPIVIILIADKKRIRFFIHLNFSFKYMFTNFIPVNTVIKSFVQGYFREAGKKNEEFLTQLYERKE
jgi:hypothetical protein